ncbi:MAG TPA: choice-of-anchor A family protein [Verrucomicrobiales bacterium]|nr:choice-of-anchor A family protein [Verrucomicrobiales bacterium]
MHFRFCSRPSLRKRAFSLFETLFVVAALSCLTAVSLTVVRQVISPTADTKLRADVRQINRAIATYRAHGGNLSGVTTPEAVVEKLKTVVTDEGDKDKETVGLKGSMIDPRVQVVRANEEPRKGKEGARYDAKKQQFEVSEETGADVVESFTFGEPPAEVAKEDRNVMLPGSKDGGWIWDYRESRRSRGRLKTGSTADVAGTEFAGETTQATALVPVLNPSLSAPALASYPLSVTITNPNPANTTQLYYSLNGAAYQAYTGAVSTPPGTTIRAIAVSLDPDRLLDSATTQQAYAPTPVTLSMTDTAPSVVSYFEAGGAAASGSPAVSPLAASAIRLANAADIPARFQASSYFQVEWSFAGIPGASSAFSNGYPGESFSVTRNAYGANSGVALSYRAITISPSVFNSSALVSKTVGINRLTLSAPKVTTASSQVTLAPDFSSAIPASYRIYYNFGSDPGDNQGEPVTGTLYSSPVAAPSPGGTLYARVYPPSGSKLWFNTSTVASVVVPPASTPSDNYMGNYNVIVFTDLYTTTAIEGKTWVGDDLTNSNSFSLGRNYSPSGNENVVVVGGSLGNGNAFQVEGNGNSRLALKGSSSRGTRSINWNGGGNESSRLVYDSTIPAKTLTMQAQLQAMSAELSTVPANSTVVTPFGQSNKRVLTCSVNSSGVAIFNIAASSLFGASNLAEVSIGFASGVSESSVKGILINVTGYIVLTGNQFNFTGKFADDTWRKKILWNFPAAIIMNMAAQRMDGAVLAPYAAVTSNNDFKGSLACRQLTIQGTCFRLPFSSSEIIAMGQ